jgi:argininosuccinate lyase
VRTAIEQGKDLSELTREELEQHSELLALGDQYYSILRDGAWLESKVSEGGTSLPRLREQLQRAREAIAPHQ